MRGRKPTPPELHVLRGNPGKRGAVEGVPKTAPLMNVPEPPEWISELATEKWREVASWLVTSRILSATDLHNLEAFCCAYSRWREGEKEIAEQGIVILSGEHNIPTKNPAVTVVNEALRQMQMHGSALGLDPASRVRLAMPEQGGQDAEDHAFMARRGGKR